MRTFSELESLWQASPPPPRGQGQVRLIVLRRRAGVHEVPGAATLSPEGGVLGDRWSEGEAPEPERQVTLMMARAAELVADGQPLHLPGDNFLVDLDLGEDALPAGARVRLGAALLQVSAVPHTGCRKFSARFGQDALRWVNWKDHRGRRLRGVNCRILEGGAVRLGDAVAVL